MTEEVEYEEVIADEKVKASAKNELAEFEKKVEEFRANLGIYQQTIDKHFYDNVPILQIEARKNEIIKDISQEFENLEKLKKLFDEKYVSYRRPENPVINAYFFRMNQSYDKSKIEKESGIFQIEVHYELRKTNADSMNALNALNALNKKTDESSEKFLEKLKTDEINNEKKSKQYLKKLTKKMKKNVYAQIIAIMGVFVSVFTLISINVDFFKSSIQYIGGYSRHPLAFAICLFIAINAITVIAIGCLMGILYLTFFKGEKITFAQDNEKDKTKEK